MAPTPRPSRPAFTLLELILVLVVVATMLAVIAPRMSGLHARSKIDNAAATTLALMNVCRQRAVNEGTPYRLVLDPAEQRIWIEKLTPTGYARPETSYTDYYVWDNALTFTSQTLDEDEEGYLTVSFKPDGSAQSADLKIEQRGQTARHLRTSSPAEPYRVLVADHLDVDELEGFDVPDD